MLLSAAFVRCFRPIFPQSAEVKLLPVTRALEASGACHSILSSLPDALEATEKIRRVGEDQLMVKRKSGDRFC